MQGNIGSFIKTLEKLIGALKEMEAFVSGKETKEPVERPPAKARPMPLQKWNHPVLTVLRTQDRAMTADEVIRYVADIRGLQPHDAMVRQQVRSTLWKLKGCGQILHDKATGLYTIAPHMKDQPDSHAAS